MKRILTISLFATALLLAGCSTDSTTVTGGGGTETTNGVMVIGKAVDKTGTPLANALVQARASTYLPDSSGTGECASGLCLDTRAQPNGSFRLLVPDSSEFTLLFTTETLTGSALVSGLSGSPRVDLDTVVLSQGAGIRGVVASADLVLLKGHVRVFGMERFSLLQNNSFLLGSLPHGLLRLQIAGDNISYVNYLVQTQAGDTVALPDTLFVADITSALAAYWPCDEGVDEKVVIDASGNGLNATLSGVAYTSGTIGGALQFPGKNQTAAAGAAFSPSDSGTVAFWFNADTIPTDKTIRLFSSDTTAFEISLWSGCVSNELFAKSTDFLKDSTVLKPRIWYHIACTWNYATHEAAIYRNGNLVAQGATANDFPGNVKISFGISPVHGSPFAGRLDDVRIYRCILDLTQVRVLAAGGH